MNANAVHKFEVQDGEVTIDMKAMKGRDPRGDDFEVRRLDLSKPQGEFFLCDPEG